MATVLLNDAQAKLPDLIRSLVPGETVIIEGAGVPVARLTREAADTPLKPRSPGSAIGKLTVVSDDDDHLSDFTEYMP